MTDPGQDWRLKVNVDDLRRMSDTLLSYLEKTDRTEFEIPHDYYWWIDQEEVYDPQRDPKVEQLGQLSEDWTRLSEIAAGDEPPIGYALVWLSAVLRVVGEQAVS